MKKLLFCFLILAISFAVMAFFQSVAEEKTAAGVLYAGGVNGHIKYAIAPPPLSGSFSLVFDFESSSGTLSMHMLESSLTCEVTSADGKSFSVDYSGGFHGSHVSGPIEGEFIYTEGAKVPDEVEGTFELSAPFEGGVVYTGKFQGKRRK